MIKCMIVDDEIHNVAIIERYVKQTSFLYLVHSNTNPIEAMKVLQTEAIDIVYLDINMPEINGLDFINTVTTKAKFILCTAFEQYAAESYELDVIDFCVKPITYNRFLKATNKAVRYIELSNSMAQKTGYVHLLPTVDKDYIFLSVNGSKSKKVKTFFNDIAYLEVQENYVIVHTATEKMLTLTTLKNLMQQLPEQIFMRIHNSYAININSVKYINSTEIALTNPSIILPISSSYKEEVKERLKTEG